MCIPTRLTFEYSTNRRRPRPGPAPGKKPTTCPVPSGVKPRRGEVIIEEKDEEEELLVEIAPGQAARLASGRRSRRRSGHGKRPVRLSDGSDGLEASHWLCTGCEEFVDIELGSCFKCGMGRRTWREEIIEKPAPPACGSDKGDGDCAPDPCCERETIDYERLKEMMLEAGKDVARDVLDKEKEGCGDKAPPLEQKPPPPPPPPPSPREIAVPYPIIVREPYPVPQPRGHSSGSSSSGSSVSRRSLERVREHVRGLGRRVSQTSGRVSLLSHRLSDAEGRIGSVAGRVSDVSDRVATVSERVQAQGLGLEAAGARIDAVDGRVRRVERDLRDRSRSRGRSRGRARRGCEVIEWRDDAWWDDERVGDCGREVERDRYWWRRRAEGQVNILPVPALAPRDRERNAERLAEDRERLAELEREKRWERRRERDLGREIGRERERERVDRRRARWW